MWKGREEEGREGSLTHLWHSRTMKNTKQLRSKRAKGKGIPMGMLLSHSKSLAGEDPCDRVTSRVCKGQK